MRDVHLLETTTICLNCIERIIVEFLQPSSVESGFQILECEGVVEDLQRDV
jgi:hypothetical protein